MSDATAICLVSDIYSMLSVSDSADESLIQNLIDRKTEHFERYCGLDSFYVADYVEYYDGQGSNLVFVKNIPINSVTEIAVDADWSWGTDTVVDSDDYRVVEDRYIIYQSYFDIGIQNIKVSYNAGYSTIPLDLKQVLIDEVVRTYNRRKEQDVLIKTLQDGSTHYVPSGLMPSTRHVLSRYKTMRST